MPELTEERKKVNSRRWRVHVHTYETAATPDVGHQHRLLGVCCPAKAARRKMHTHGVYGRTSFSGNNNVDLHWHAYEITSDLNVELADGSHVHYFAGVTSTDAGHRHTFSGATNLGPDFYNNTAGPTTDANNGYGYNCYKSCGRLEEEENGGEG
jgi:uncharacterized protein YfaP (DUF2135 family)